MGDTQDAQSILESPIGDSKHSLVIRMIKRYCFVQLLFMPSLGLGNHIIKAISALFILALSCIGAHSQADTRAVDMPMDITLAFRVIAHSL